jgi:hypothetical protein
VQFPFSLSILCKCSPWTPSSFRSLRYDRPPDPSLLFGAVFRDPASIRFRERTPESSGFKVLAVSRRSGLLPPGVVQITTIDRIEAKVVNKAKHCCRYR